MMTDREKEQLEGLYGLVSGIKSAVKEGVPVPDRTFDVVLGTLWCLLDFPEGEYGGGPSRLREAVEAEMEAAT